MRLAPQAPGLLCALVRLEPFKTMCCITKICNNVQLKGVKNLLQKKPSAWFHIYLNKGIKRRNNPSCQSDLGFDGATYCISEDLSPTQTLMRSLQLNLSPPKNQKDPKLQLAISPSKRVKILASLAKPTPTDLEKTLNTIPWQFLITPPIPSWLGLPREHPSRFHLIEPNGGGVYIKSILQPTLIDMQTIFQSSCRIFNGVSSKVFFFFFFFDK